MLNFLFSFLCVCHSYVCSMIKSFNHAKFMSNWVVRIKLQILIRVRGFPVDWNVQWAVRITRDASVKKNKMAILFLFTSKFYAGVLRIDVFEELVDTPDLGIIKNVSSTKRSQILFVTGDVLSVAFSKCSIYKFAITGLTELPIAQPPHCW